MAASVCSDPTRCLPCGFQGKAKLLMMGIVENLGKDFVADTLQLDRVNGWPYQVAFPASGDCMNAYWKTLIATLAMVVVLGVAPRTFAKQNVVSGRPNSANSSYVLQHRVRIATIAAHVAVQRFSVEEVELVRELLDTDAVIKQLGALLEVAVAFVRGPVEGGHIVDHQEIFRTEHFLFFRECQKDLRRMGSVLIRVQGKIFRDTLIHSFTPSQIGMSLA